MRIETWVNDLQDYVEEVKDTPFEWGAHDCCLFASDVFKLFHGYDPAQHVRGQYTTRKGAMKELKKSLPKELVKDTNDFASLMAIFMEQHRMIRKEPNFLQRGDLICYLEPVGGYENVGIVSLNPLMLMAPGKNNLEYFEIEKASLIDCWGL